MLKIRKATKKQCKLKMIISGIPGSGKTYSALNIAKHLVPGGKFLMLDSEYCSSEKYADIFDFDIHEVNNPDPRNYIRAIAAVEKEGYDVLIIDSMTHAWQALLDIVTEAGKNSYSPYGGWNVGTPIQKKFIESILAAKIHVIATARAKSDYVINPNAKGKLTPKKVGMKSEQRENIEYEFDIAGEIDGDHTMKVTKSRCPEVDQKSFYLPGEEFTTIVRGWLNSGAADDAAEEEKKTNSTTGENDVTQPSGGVDTATSQTATTSRTASDVVSKVSVEKMKQLTKAAKANGWDQKKLSDYILHAFDIKVEDLAKKFNEKNWEATLKIVSNPKNKDGVVTVASNGKQLNERDFFPPKKQED